MLIYVYLIARYLLKNKPEIHFSKWKYFPKMKIFDEQRIEQEKLEAERKAREEAREKERLERQKLKNSPEYKKRRASYER